MRKLKKVAALLLTLAMVMGLSLTAFAAETKANIRVNGLTDDAEIKYMQIVEPDPTSPQGWKFVDEDDNDSPITNAFISAFDVATAEEAIDKLIDLGELESLDNYNAEKGKINSSVALGKALSAIQNSEQMTDENVNRHTITGIESAGLYIIKAIPNDVNFSYIPMLAYVDDQGLGTLQNVTVGAKGSENTIDKNLTNPDTDGSVSAGDEVEYTATVTYPYYSPDEEQKTFTITDTLTNATFKQDSIKITVGEDDLEADEDYTLSFEENTKAVINFNYNAAYASQTVTLTYTVVVGNGTDGLVNNITTNLDTDGDSVESDQVSVKVTKQDESKNPLNGAKFTIYEATGSAAEGYDTVSGVKVMSKDNAVIENQTLYLKQVGDGTTNVDGELIFAGLDADKTYYVKETEAPTGYRLNEYYYAVGTTTKNDGESSDDHYVYNDFSDLTVINQDLASLPSTGGIGTTIFTIGGCVIMIAAAGLYFASRRKNSAN